MDDKGQALLKEVSSEGNGKFMNVHSKEELDMYLRQQYELQILRKESPLRCVSTPFKDGMNFRSNAMYRYNTEDTFYTSSI